MNKMPVEPVFLFVLIGWFVGLFIWMVCSQQNQTVFTRHWVPFIWFPIVAVVTFWLILAVNQPTIINSRALHNIYEMENVQYISHKTDSGDIKIVNLNGKLRRSFNKEKILVITKDQDTYLGIKFPEQFEYQVVD
jgi:hypothetical protein